MQAAIDARVPHVRDGLIVANVGGVINVGGAANVGGVTKVTEATIHPWECL
jgi:hypothetical protein